jgi:hypothetical protein
LRLGGWGGVWEFFGACKVPICMVLIFNSWSVEGCVYEVQYRIQQV